MSLEQVLAYAQANQSKYLGWLSDLVEVPSVSLPGFDYQFVRECGARVTQLLHEVGLNNIREISAGDDLRPYIYGEWLGAPGKPTVLFYSHYDVQPVGDLERWNSPPFTLTERKGRLYGRGSADDKGGLVAELAVLDALLKTTGRLPINVKVLIEGEEEDGSTCLPKFIAQHKELIKADAIVIVDAENFSEDTAGLTISLRGLLAVSLEVRTLKQPVHSGLWGGPLPDAAMALTKIVSTLVDHDGNIQIPDILRMIQPVSEAAKKQLSLLPIDDQKLRSEAGLLPGVPLLGGITEARERMWFRPTLGINAIQASSRNQAGNIIVDAAWAKVGLRTVPDIDGERAYLAMKEYLMHKVPFGLSLDVKLLSMGRWWQTQTTHPFFSSMLNSLEKGWRKPPVQIGCGASIPFVQTFSDALEGAPALLLGVADPLTLAHSENESLSIDGWNKTVASLIYFMSEVI